MPSNLPRNILPSGLPNIYGNAIENGLRVGKSAAREGTNPTVSGSMSPISAPPRLNLDQWGPGVYTGGIFTYRISPSPVSEDTNYDPSEANKDNIVRQVVLEAPIYGSFLSLASYEGTRRSTQLYYDGAGNPAILMDYPRCVTLYSEGDQGYPIVANIYGWDLYGQRMMEAITLPDNTLQITGNKAFQAITAVYIEESDNPVTGIYFAVGASNQFGLPFALSQASHMIAYSQGDVSMQNAVTTIPGWQEVGYITPYTLAGSDPLITIPYQWGVPGNIISADTQTPSATTYDVRGVFKPNNTYVWDTITDPYTFSDPSESNNNWTTADNAYLTFTYYIAGADMYQNVIQQQIQSFSDLALDPSVFQDLWSGFESTIPSRNQDSQKGLLQYWEEPPSV